MSNIACLCCIRNAAHHLPGFMANICHSVDSVIFLSDRCNSDQAFLSRSEIKKYKNATLILRDSETCQGDAPFLFEVRNRALLMHEARFMGASHILAMDVDERLGVPFLKQIRDCCHSSSVRLWSRNVWGDENHIRMDGIWQKKEKAVLFPVDYIESCLPKSEGLHQPWMIVGDSAPVGEIFHLGGMTPELRAERVRRHNQSDPNNNYDYLANETGMVLETIAPGRGWR